MLTTLLLSFGVLLLGGDELGRTQGGNNNAYSQDNEISWDAVDSGLASGPAWSGGPRSTASTPAPQLSSR